MTRMTRMPGTLRPVPVHWCWANEQALLARVEEEDLATAAEAARSLRRRVAELAGDASGERELVVGAASLLVRFSAIPHADDVAPLLGIREIESGAGDAEEPAEHRFEVAYGGTDGPDLADVARLVGRTEGEVVALHSRAAYTVAFVGFSPGFAYLLGLPRELELPRLASPRPRVPAGSVAIAGAFAGIYPQGTPGGWRLLGQTAATLFAADSVPPALLAPGDRVRFVPR